MKKTILKHKKYFAAWLLIATVALLVSLYFDKQLMVLVTSFRNPIATWLMLGSTYLLELYVGLPILLILLFYKDKSHDKNIFWDAIVALFIDVCIAIVLKTVIMRPRPYTTMKIDNLITAHLSSFPSGHSSRAFTFFGILSKHKPAYKIIFYSLATMVALSRLYLGVHYVSDVIAGIAIGTLISKVVYELKIGSSVHKLFRKTLKRIKTHTV